MNWKDIKPIKIVAVELSQPLPEVNERDDSGKARYDKALVLAKLHDYPLGQLEIEFVSGRISPAQLAIECWAMLSEQINQHLFDDGLGEVHYLSSNGLTSEELPKCRAQRQKLIQEAPLISVVIATRDRVHSLEKTLNSLLIQEYPQFEVILVDNAPKTSATYDFYIDSQPLFQRRNISLRYTREDTPGLAVAHNLGLQAVRSSIVAFTDDDVIVDKYWLVELLRGFEAAPSVGCVTGLVIPMELETPAQILFEEFGGFTKGFTRVVYDLESHRPRDPLFPYTAGRFGTGANMAYRTDLLLEAGGFDPALGIGTPSRGADDMATFHQIIQQGHQLVYQPSALVHHQHRRTYEELQRQMFGYGVGLTAFLTKCLMDRPQSIFDIIPKVPGGIKYAFSSESRKNKHKSEDYPRELEWIERKGMLSGPFAYLYSCWNYRHFRKAANRPKLTNEVPLSQQFTVRQG